MAEKKINWGVMGAAGIAYSKWIPGINRTDHARLTALASDNPETRGRRFQSRFRIERLYGSYAELLEDSEIQAVYIPLPNHLQFEWAKRAALKGKHVLCEKPLTLNAAESAELFAVFKERSLILTEAFMYRFDPRIRRALSLLAEGAVGQIRRVKACFSFAASDHNNIRFRRRTGGGALYDIGCYDINICRLLMGAGGASTSKAAGAEPVAVRGQLRSRQGSDVDDEGEAWLYFSGDRVGIIDFGFNSPWQERVIIEGQTGRMELLCPYTSRGIQPTILICTQDQSNFEPRFKTESFGLFDDYALETDAFSKKLLGLDDELFEVIPWGDAAMNMRVIEAIRRSSESGQIVELGSGGL